MMKMTTEVPNVAYAAEQTELLHLLYHKLCVLLLPPNNNSLLLLFLNQLTGQSCAPDHRTPRLKTANSALRCLGVKRAGV